MIVGVSCEVFGGERKGGGVQGILSTMQIKADTLKSIRPSGIAEAWGLGDVALKHGIYVVVSQITVPLLSI